jgi:hypothetical protein
MGPGLWRRPAPRHELLVNLALCPQEFIRLGSLSKLSGKGLQQRMFFLVSGASSSLSPWSWDPVAPWQGRVTRLSLGHPSTQAALAKVTRL